MTLQIIQAAPFVMALQQSAYIFFFDATEIGALSGVQLSLPVSSWLLFERRHICLIPHTQQLLRLYVSRPTYPSNAQSNLAHR